jgi:hypothetical protein
MYKTQRDAKIKDFKCISYYEASVNAQTPIKNCGIVLLAYNLHKMPRRK